MATLAPVAATADCRLALLLAIDVSSSVDAAEDILQRGGIAAALSSPEVAAVFLASDQHVALAAYEWSGRYNQQILLDWTIVKDRETLFLAAEKIANSKRSHNDFPTAMGYALGYGAGVMERAPSCEQQTLDVAGDGQNNEGFTPAQAYAAFFFEKITVNGLVINGADFEAETGLIAYYKGNVIRGPGAFVEVAAGFEDYERAMRRKLERELALPILGSVDVFPSETVRK
ncbi:MAG: DUF1194 domain-containing protein [Roseobacter sp.]